MKSIKWCSEIRPPKEVKFSVFLSGKGTTYPQFPKFVQIRGHLLDLSGGAFFRMT